MSRPANDPNYVEAHRRVRAAGGDARAWHCVDCHGRAAEWSYIRADPAEIMTTQGPFSSKTGEPYYYVPRCTPCHRTLDAAVHRATGGTDGQTLPLFQYPCDHGEADCHTCAECRRLSAYHVLRPASFELEPWSESTQTEADFEPLFDLN